MSFCSGMLCNVAVWNNATTLLPTVSPFGRNHPINEFSQAVLTLLQCAQMQRSAMQYRTVQFLSEMQLRGVIKYSNVLCIELSPAPKIWNTS